MREIKFRAWDKIANRMIPWEDLYFSKGFAAFKNDSYEWLQFTGLKDKNGKEIYEGDIIAFGDVPMVVVYETHSVEKWTWWMCRSEWVRWADDKGNSGATNMGGFGALTEKNCMGVGVRVAGNIFENPELLKVGAVCP